MNLKLNRMSWLRNLLKEIPKVFEKKIRSTNATKSKLPHAVDETEGECENPEMWHHRSKQRLNFYRKLEIKFSRKCGVCGN